MLIKYVLIAILIVLLISILYDGIKNYLAKRKEKRTLQSKQAGGAPPSGPDDQPPAQVQ